MQVPLGNLSKKNLTKDYRRDLVLVRTIERTRATTSSEPFNLFNSMDDETDQAQSDKRKRVKLNFVLNGCAIGEWADARGYNRALVYAVLNGRSVGLRGRSHEIAVALGLKGGPDTPASADLGEFFASRSGAAHPSGRIANPSNDTHQEAA